jgi:iron(III) transport system ATP-binding protein
VLSIEQLTKRFRSGAEQVVAVNNVTIDVEPGELLVLLGPSGCGKTTALRCLAGLESADEGRISFGGNQVFDAARAIDVAPEKRGIGMVFQSYALWPHKTVRSNIAYPLKVRKMKQELSDGFVEKITEVVDCTKLLDRYPGQLSGGQQQRVALARGLVAQPSVVLFDEPLSNLDALLRMQVRAELHELHKRLRFTGVYVTHDQSEALALGDRLAVMQKGSVAQIGTPRDIYERPTTSYVAEFVGFSNRLDLKRTGSGWQPDGSQDTCDLPVERNLDQVELRFRPEQCVITQERPSSSPGVSLPGVVVDKLYAGTHEELTVAIGSSRITVHVSVDDNQQIQLGASVFVTIPENRCRFYSSTGQAV